MASILHLMIFIQFLMCYLGKLMWIQFEIYAGRIISVASELLVFVSGCSLEIIVMIQQFWISMILWLLFFIREIIPFCLMINWKLVGLVFYCIFALILINAPSPPTREEQIKRYLEILAERRRTQICVRSFEYQTDD